MAYRDADADAGIAAARRAILARADLQERLAAARAEQGRLGDAMAEAAIGARKEDEDVARLEAGGPRALLAKVTGRFDALREREVAEAEAAHRAYDEERAEFARLGVVIADLERELRALGDVESQMQAALVAHARRVHERGGGPAGALAALEAEREELRQRDGHLAAVLAAGHDAFQRVAAVLKGFGIGPSETGGNTHLNVGPDLPVMRAALTELRLALSRLPAGLVDRPLPDIPLFDPAWKPRLIFSGDGAAERAVQQIAAAITDALIILEERRHSLRAEQQQLAARWAELVARS